MRALEYVLTLTMIPLLLTGCSMRSDETPNPTPTESTAMTGSDVRKEIAKQKSRTQHTEREILDNVPSVSDVEQHEDGALFMCADGRRQWVGGTDVILSEGADPLEAIKSLGRTLEGKLTFRSQSGTDSSGRPNLSLYGKDGENYLISVGVAPSGLSMVSSSDCFSVPETSSGAGAW